jgi:hypothetical protein
MLRGTLLTWDGLWILGCMYDIYHTRLIGNVLFDWVVVSSPTSDIPVPGRPDRRFRMIPPDQCAGLILFPDQGSHSHARISLYACSMIHTVSIIHTITHS